MKWQGRRRSTNVTDARGKRVAVSTAGLAAVLNFEGKVVPHAFTHGTSEQRMRWFELGVDSGDIEDAKDIFKMPYESL